MRIVTLHIEGFGTLSEEDFAFEPTFNLVFGPNEAGKSTLQQAILAMLYGFYSGERITKSEKQLHARFRPWQGVHYSGKIVVELDNNVRYMITRDFDTPEPQTHIYEANTGKEVTEMFHRKRRGYVGFCERLTGMSRAVFESVSCVRQGQLTKISGSEAQDIADTIVRLVDSASTDVSVKKALEKISAAIRNLGTDKSRSGPIYAARTELSRCEQLIQERTALVETLSSDYQALTDHQSRLAALKQESETLSEELRHAEYFACVELLNKHAGLAHRREVLNKRLHELSPNQNISPEDHDLVIRLMEERKISLQRRKRLNDAIQQQNLLRASEKDYIATLPVAESLWLSDTVQRFEDYFQQWQDLHEKTAEARDLEAELSAGLREMGYDKEAIEALKSLSPATLEEFEAMTNVLEEKKSDLNALQNRAELQKSNARIIRAGLGTLLSAAFLVYLLAMLVPDFKAFLDSHSLISNTLNFITMIIAIVWLFFESIGYVNRLNDRDRSRQVMAAIELQEQEIRDSLQPYGVSSTEALTRLYIQINRLSEIDAVMQNRLEDLKQLEERLSPLCSAFGFEILNIETLQRIAETLQRGKAAREKIRELDRTISEYQEELRLLNHRLGEIDSELKSIFATADLQSESIADDAQAFLARVREAEESIELEKELAQLQELEKEMLAGRRIEEVRHMAEKLREGLQDERAETIPERTATVLQELLRENRRQQQKIEIEIATISERISERESRLPDFSELEENAAIARRRLDELIHKRQALELAYETLTDVAQKAHKEFAPRLAGIVSKQLTQISEGRYKELFVDPEQFQIRITHGRGKTLVPLDYLSLGTQEQVYLMLRSAVARLLSENSEAIPLLLDDPLAHADEVRQGLTLNRLLEIAEQHQLIYFTKDKSIIDALAEMKAEYNLITLNTSQRIMPHRWAAGTAFRRLSDEE